MILLNFRTLNDLNSLIFENLHRIPADVDLIVGVPRSGMFAAYLIASYLHLPVADVDALEHGDEVFCGKTRVRADWIHRASEAKKVLLVEDSCHYGRTISALRQRLKGLPCEIIYLAVIVAPEGLGHPDLWFDLCETPRMFEWNCFQHRGLAYSAFDIDGVLCRDPTPEENDDGPRYRAFLRTVEPRLHPQYPIGCLITSRLEKYRPETEDWLRRGGIAYGKLLMMPYATAAERHAAGAYGRFKGERYRELAELRFFVESEPWQAEEIARVSGKGVFCPKNHRYYSGEQDGTQA